MKRLENLSAYCLESTVQLSALKGGTGEGDTKPRTGKVKGPTPLPGGH